MVKLSGFLILVLLLVNCQSNCNKAQKPKATNAEMNLQIDKINFKTYYLKEKIPILVLDSLSSINGSKFEIGDSTDIDNISFSDANLGEYKYNKMLHFISLSDSISLISYRQGGIGTHDIVDIFYNANNTHKRYLSNNDLSTLNRVINFLKEQ